MKLCYVCREEKELSEFSQNLKKKDNLNSECKECQKKYFKEYYKKNKEKHIKAVFKVNNCKRNKVSQYKIERGCSKCGFNKHPAALEFHHIDSKTKKYTIAANIHLDWEDLIQEINKCEILCANCHAIEHAAEFYIDYDIKKTKSRVKNKKIFNKSYHQDFCSCGKLKSKISKRCSKCANTEKSKSPTKEELEVLIFKMPSTEIAKIYNVSDKAICLWCKKYNLSKPSRGYWTKRKSH